MEFKSVLQEILRRSVVMQDPGVQLQPKVIAAMAQANAADVKALLEFIEAEESMPETPQQVEGRLRDARARYLLCSAPAIN